MATVTLTLTGDVMTGRGIDQVLPHPGSPAIHERYALSALDYVALAERRHGPIPRPVDPAWIWGDAFAVLDEVVVANVETAITDRGEPWPDKGIHYRMHPANLPCLAPVDVAVLANNHVLDWSEAGLVQTLEATAAAGLPTVGAGVDRAAAEAPAVVDGVVVVGVGSATSGIPPAWAATDDRPGVAMADPLSEAVSAAIAGRVSGLGRPAVVSIHWGPNWGFGVPVEFRRFAHALVEAGVDVVHGHSSHHPMAIEMHRGRPILYGCGDLVNDYEGIAGYESYHPDLGVVYRLEADAGSGEAVSLRLLPFVRRRFRLETAPADEAAWLASTLTREGRRWGTVVEVDGADGLIVRW